MSELVSKLLMQHVQLEVLLRNLASQIRVTSPSTARVKIAAANPKEFLQLMQDLQKSGLDVADELAKTGIPPDKARDLAKVLDTTASAEFTVFQEWQQVCGEPLKKDSRTLETSGDLTTEAVKFQCSKDPRFGEIHYVRGSQTHIVKSLDIEADWANVNTPTFSLSGFLTNYFQTGQPSEVAQQVAQQQSAENIKLALRKRFEQLLLAARPALELHAQLVPDRDILDPLCRDVQQALLAFGNTQTQLALLATEIEAAKAYEECVALFEKVRQLHEFTFNAAVIKQLSIQLQECDAAREELKDDEPGDLSKLAANVVNMSALRNMLQGPSLISRREQQARRVLIPCADNDFAMILDEGLALFEACSTPMGHVCICEGKCLQGTSAEQLDAVDCTSHNFLDGVTLFAATCLLQRDASDFDVRKLATVKLQQKFQVPLSTYKAFIHVSEKRRSDVFLSVPDDKGYASVSRRLMPPGAVIVFSDTTGCHFIVQSAAQM